MHEVRKMYSYKAILVLVLLESRTTIVVLDETAAVFTLLRIIDAQDIN